MKINNAKYPKEFSNMINTNVDGSSKSDNNADNFDYFFHHVQYFEWMFCICTVGISLYRDNLYVNLYMMCLMYRIVYIGMVRFGSVWFFNGFWRTLNRTIGSVH